MIKKKFCFIPVLIIVFLLPVSLNAQFISESENEISHLDSPFDLNMEVGTSFTTGFGGTSFFTHSFSPHILWNTSERFTLQIGTVLSSTSFTGGQPMRLMPEFSGAQNNMAIIQDNLYRNITYTMGYYSINENLTLKGGAYVDASNFDNSLHQIQMNPQAFNLNAKGMIMGFDYQISDKVSVGAEFNMRSGQSPYNYYMQSPFSSPATHHSPFNRYTNP